MGRERQQRERLEERKIGREREKRRRHTDKRREKIYGEREIG